MDEIIINKFKILNFSDKIIDLYRAQKNSLKDHTAAS